MTPSISNFEHLAIKETYTSKEILGQPSLWKEIYKKILSEQEDIQQFFDKQQIDHDINVILAGAGSSAFIGEISQFAFRKAGYKCCKAISTTDMVTHFTEWVDTSRPLLLVSFGRSGNSPESKAVLELANKYCDNVSHLVISCNQDGQLARKATATANSYAFILPSVAEDKGLAMTGSFSGMLLAASLIADLPHIQTYESTVPGMAEAGISIFEKYLPILNEIANKDFKRIIFLGDGPNLGCARESHLKVQELSDGICIGKFDSFLGFRHGPKAVVDSETLLIYLLSNKDEVKQYQFDLIRQIADQKLGMYSLSIGGTRKVENYVDTNMYLPDFGNYPEHLLPILYVLAAQLIGLFKAEALHLDPDNPSQNGAISRVVEGVTIY